MVLGPSNAGALGATSVVDAKGRMVEILQLFVVASAVKIFPSGSAAHAIPAIQVDSNGFGQSIVEII